MSMLIYTSAEDAIDLGDPFAAWSAFAEMAKVAGGEDWPELYGVPHAAEQGADPQWLAKVREQASAFLSRHGPDLSAGARGILKALSAPQ